MFKNNIANTLPFEIASTDTVKAREYIYVRYAVEFGLESGHTGGKAHRIKALIARLLDATEEMVGDRMPKRGLFRQLLKLDGLTPAQRQAGRESLGADMDNIKQFVSDDLIKALTARSIDPEGLKAPLKEILKGRLGHFCWGSSINHNDIKTAVANVITKMSNNLGAGEVQGGPLVGTCLYKNRKLKTDAAKEGRGPISAAESGRYNRRKGNGKKKA